MIETEIYTFDLCEQLTNAHNIIIKDNINLYKLLKLRENNNDDPIIVKAVKKKLNKIKKHSNLLYPSFYISARLYKYIQNRTYNKKNKTNRSILHILIDYLIFYPSLEIANIIKEIIRLDIVDINLIDVQTLSNPLTRIIFIYSEYSLELFTCLLNHPKIIVEFYYMTADNDGSHVYYNDYLIILKKFILKIDHFSELFKYYLYNNDNLDINKILMIIFNKYLYSNIFNKEENIKKDINCIKKISEIINIDSNIYDIYISQLDNIIFIECIDKIIDECDIKFYYLK